MSQQIGAVKVPKFNVQASLRFICAWNLKIEIFLELGFWD